jgi:4-hydroxy-2-oxoglutarate aldolase
MTLSLAGVFAPVTTPFVAGGEIDAKGFAANIKAHIEAGLSGVVVGGSTGEAALLDEAERSSLVEIARDLVPRGKAVIVGAGAESTRYAIRLAKNAATRGADAVLVVAPHYYSTSMTAEALLRHYRAIADASAVPVILYNIPKYMHFSLPNEVVAELARHPNVIGIKDSSGNKKILGGFMALRSATFSVLVGNGAILNHALTTGAAGGILGVSLFAPSLALEIYSAFRRGDGGTATFVQERLAPLHTKIVAELGVAGVKAAMDAVGLKGGSTRSPLLPLGEAQRREVASLLETAELVAA